MYDPTGWFEDEAEAWQQGWRDAVHGLYGTRGYSPRGVPAGLLAALPAQDARDWYDHGFAPRQAVAWHLRDFTPDEACAWASALLEDDDPRIAYVCRAAGLSPAQAADLLFP